MEPRGSWHVRPSAGLQAPAPGAPTDRGDGCLRSGEASWVSETRLALPPPAAVLRPSVGWMTPIDTGDSHLLVSLSI